jgi:hypothetical protein
LPATQDRDLGNLGFDRHAARGGQHARQRRRRPLDRVDALRRHRARDRDTVAPSPGLAADDDLRVGRLFVEIARDHLAQLFGRVAGGADAAGIGDEDEPGAVDLHAFDARRVAAFAGQQAVAHVLVDGQRQKIAGADHLGIGCAGIDERRGKAQDRCGRRHGGHARVDLDDEGVALVLDGTGEKLVAGGAGAGAGAHRTMPPTRRHRALPNGPHGRPAMSRGWLLRCLKLPRGLFCYVERLVKKASTRKRWFNVPF